MGDLTTNFGSKEFACPCCGRVKVDGVLVASLQRMRDFMGESIYITSGFRCSVYNRLCGGVKRSQHVSGKAADIWAADMDGLFLAAKVEFINGGIGIYPDANFIHVDTRGTKARWGRVNGEYVSYQAALGPWMELIKGALC